MVCKRVDLRILVALDLWVCTLVSVYCLLLLCVCVYVTLLDDLVSFWVLCFVCWFLFA